MNASRPPQWILPASCLLLSCVLPARAALIPSDPWLVDIPLTIHVNARPVTGHLVSNVVAGAGVLDTGPPETVSYQDFELVFPPQRGIDATVDGAHFTVDFAGFAIPHHGNQDVHLSPFPFPVSGGRMATLGVTADRLDVMPFATAEGTWINATPAATWALDRGALHLGDTFAWPLGAGGIGSIGVRRDPEGTVLGWQPWTGGGDRIAEADYSYNAGGFAVTSNVPEPASLLLGLCGLMGCYPGRKTCRNPLCPTSSVSS